MSVFFFWKSALSESVKLNPCIIYNIQVIFNFDRKKIEQIENIQY